MQPSVQAGPAQFALVRNELGRLRSRAPPSGPGVAWPGSCHGSRVEDPCSKEQKEYGSFSASVASLGIVPNPESQDSVVNRALD